MLCHATPTRCWVDVPGIARYEVADGAEIVVEPMADADPAAVAAFLTSSVVGAAIHQRASAGDAGLLLEAAVVARGSKAVAVVAHAGDGQSSLAATLTWRGFDFVADDMAHVDVVDGAATVHVGTSAARLWPDALLAHDVVPTDHPQVHPGILKRTVELRAEPANFAPLELVGCIVVSTGQDDEVHAAELSGGQRFRVLGNHTWRRRLVTAGQYRNEHFAQLVALAAATKVARITRPRHDRHFDAVADAAIAIIDRWIEGDE